MATNTIHTHVFENGLVLIAEPMDWLESAACTCLIPAGAAHDPADRAGLSTFTSEMVERGCGTRNSRQFVEDLENLGVDHHCSTNVAFTGFSAAMMAEHLERALSIHVDLVRRPHLPADQLEDARLVCLQELRSVEDELAQKTMEELRRLHYPDPWGRSPHGKCEDLEAIAIEDVRAHFQRCYHPAGTILAVAGKFSWQRMVDHVGELLGDWSPGPRPTFVETASPPRYLHIPCESSQTHVGIAYSTVPCRHADFYKARAAVGVLSDGMSSRLFSEVRENRGLCYSVQASYHSLCDRGSVLCYAGTSPQRAQETLDVTLSELARLGAGINASELARVKARVKSALILQQESSSSRSSSLAWDWYYLGRTQTLEEISGIIDALTCESINAYLAERPPHDFTIVTLGDAPLETDLGVPSRETG